ncbi:uncharacterized protein RCO7_04602 [Rhynchosporium graminicola]|uniref:Uncharacterized protein n=1 Tax=Rhynchosporium graminicola TaxID=2792576 RepID=A0A1E1JTC4_9HELO|nr:uncharacterized protein RCO7_04602 [Rhynchosporium commune]
MGPPQTTRSSYATAPSALDPTQLVYITILSFSSEWHFKPDGIKLVQKRFEVELAKLEKNYAWNFQVENRWVPEYAMWQVRCAKGDDKHIWPAFFTVMNGVIREAIYTASQKNGGLDGIPQEPEEEDDDEDYHFTHDEPLDSNLIERLAVWKMDKLLEDPKAEPESADEMAQIETQLTPVSHDETFPEAIRFYKFRQAWQCGDKGITLDVIFPEADLKELVRLTSCQFSMNLDEGVMFIGAHEEANILLAIHKLDNVEKNLQYRHAWVNHIFYNEGTANAKYLLKYFVDLRMSYFETTLLDNLQVAFSHGACDYEALTNAVTVRCAPYDPVKSGYIPINKVNISKINVEDVPGGVRVFSAAFIYNGKGVPSDNPMLHRPAHIAPVPAEQSNLQLLQSSQRASAPQFRNPSVKDESVQRWATSVPDALGSRVGTNSNGLPDILQVLPNGAVVVSDYKASPKKPAWDSYEEYSPEKAASAVRNEFTWNQTKDGPFGIVNRPLAANHAVRDPRPRAPIAKGTPRKLTSAMPRSSSMPQVTIGSDGLMEPLKPTILRQQTSQPLQPFPSLPRLQQRRSAATQQSSRIHARSVSQSAVPPSQPSLINRRLFSDTIAKSSHVHVSLLDEDDLLAASLPVDVLQPVTKPLTVQGQAEKMQLIEEAETRVFHQTMNQRAPRPKKHNPFAGRLERPSSPPKSTVSSSSSTKAITADPVPEFIEEFNQSFKELMAGLRGYRGKVVVQAEFGRIILGRFHPKQLSVKEHLRFLDGPYLQDMLLKPTQYGPTMDFTSVLTAVTAEIQYIVNMKDQNGKDIWEKDKVTRWTTTYEFIFTDIQDPLYPVMIEIDAETFVAQIKARCCLGNLFVYGTKRHWDVKVAAIGYGNKRAMEDKYGDLATEVQSSLYIPPNSHRPYLSWKLNTSLQKRFVIQDLIVRRVYEYKSTDHKSVLKVSELQSLDIDGGPAAEKPFWIFEAKPGNPDLAPIDKLTMWYEASTSSVELDAVVKQNESLDLGDETAWTLEDVANMGASKALYLPALVMLKQMDGVGQNSLNGSDYRIRRQNAHIMQAQAVEAVVWW